MAIKQVSVFVENKFGRVAEILDILKDNDINMSALSLADTTGFGILRLIVNDPSKTADALRNQGITVKTTDVLAVSMDDKPGGLASLLNILKEAQVSIEYMYAFIGKNEGTAAMVMKVDDQAKAVNCLESKGVYMLDAHDIYRL
ncbi:MAG: acetolactate synthase [Clostridiales bacterium]|nr:acetolactate synthase [Clostridiales bacterium]